MPNRLTFLRVAAVPIMLLLYPWDFVVLKVSCAVVFALAAITDFFDGYLARKYQLETKLGAILDPISDKVLVTSAIIILTSALILPAWIASLIICREIAVSGLRLAAYNHKVTIEVNSIGKWKTAFQGLAITMLLTGFAEFHTYGMLLLWTSIALSYFSAYIYWTNFWKVFRDEVN